MTADQNTPATIPPQTAMDSEAIEKAIRRMAHEIVERHDAPGRIVLAGIPTRGVEVANRLADYIEKIEGVRP